MYDTIFFFNRLASSLILTTICGSGGVAKIVSANVKYFFVKLSSGSVVARSWHQFLPR